MALGTLLRLLLRAGKAKKAAKALSSAKKLSKLPQKSKGVPGVVKRPTYKVGSEKWKRQIREDVQDFARRRMGRDYFK